MNSRNPQPLVSCPVFWSATENEDGPKRNISTTPQESSAQNWNFLSLGSYLTPELQGWVDFEVTARTQKRFIKKGQNKPKRRDGKNEKGS